MTAAEHLMQFHKDECAHQKSMATMEANEATRQKVAGDLDRSNYHSLKSAEHFKRAESHAQSIEECNGAMKAQVAALNKVVPDKFSSVLPSDVPGFGIRAVPRTGAPAVHSGPIDKASVPLEFRHLISPLDDPAA